eukprot:765592-Hanusia_phi.AAC.3
MSSRCFPFVLVSASECVCFVGAVVVEQGTQSTRRSLHRRGHTDCYALMKPWEAGGESSKWYLGGVVGW